MLLSESTARAKSSMRRKQQGWDSCAFTGENYSRTAEARRSWTQGEVDNG